MSDHVNMDLKNHKHQTVNLEYSLPANELDLAGLGEVGDRVNVIIPSEITEKSQGTVSFRKCGEASTEDYSCKDMEESLGEADQPEDRPRK